MWQIKLGLKVSLKFILLFYFIIVVNFDLFSKPIEVEWFLKLSKLLNRIETKESEIRIDILYNYTILLELGEEKGAFSIFSKPGMEFEKYELLRNYLNSNYINTNPNKKILKLILKELLQLKLPYEIDISDDLINIAYLFLKIDEKEEVVKILDLVERRTMETRIEWGCNIRAFYFSHIFKIYKLMKMEEESNKIYEKMMNFYEDCHEKFKRKFNIDNYDNKYVIFEHYADRFFELEDYKKVKLFLEKASHLFPKDDYPKYVDEMFEISEIYLKIKEKDIAIANAHKLFDFCFCKEVNSNKIINCDGKQKEIKGADRVENCLRKIGICIADSNLFKKINPSIFIEKLKIRRKDFKDNKLINAINEVLIELYIQAKEYDAAYQIAHTLDNSEFEENIRSNYILNIAVDKINYGSELNIDKLINNIKGTYYKIVLYYEIGKYYMNRKEEKKAKNYLKKAVDLLKYYKPKNIFRPHGIDLMNIGELYWKMDDTKALNIIKRYFKMKDSSNYSIPEISNWLIDIYLGKKDVNSALNILCKLKNPTHKAIGLIYIAKHFLNEGIIEKGRKYLNDAYLLLEKSSLIDYSLFFNECYRVFVYRTFPGKKNDRARFIEVRHGPEL